MMSEAAVEDRIRIAAPKLGVTLWRNNVGVLKDADGRPIRFGLCNDSSKLNKHIKSSDLIGITPMLIERHHVGRTLGIFTAIEVKREGWWWKGNAHEEAQHAFLKLVVAAGGSAMFARCEDDFVAHVGAQLAGVK
jgi:hypothetical protein